MHLCSRSQHCERWIYCQKQKKSCGAEQSEKEKKRERGSERTESVKRRGKRGEEPWGAEEQLLSAAPWRTSVHATSSSHWLALQHSSCLEQKTHHTYTHLGFWLWLTQRDSFLTSPHTDSKVTHTHSVHLRYVRLCECVSNQCSLDGKHTYEHVKLHRIMNWFHILCTWPCCPILTIENTPENTYTYTHIHTHSARGHTHTQSQDIPRLHLHHLTAC